MLTVLYPCCRCAWDTDGHIGATWWARGTWSATRVLSDAQAPQRRPWTCCNTRVLFSAPQCCLVRTVATNLPGLAATLPAGFSRDASCLSCQTSMTQTAGFKAIVPVLGSIRNSDADVPPTHVQRAMRAPAWRSSLPSPRRTSTPSPCTATSSKPLREPLLLPRRVPRPPAPRVPRVLPWRRLVSGLLTPGGV